MSLEEDDNSHSVVLKRKHREGKSLYHDKLEVVTGDIGTVLIKSSRREGSKDKIQSCFEFDLSEFAIFINTCSMLVDSLVMRDEEE